MKPEMCGKLSNTTASSLSRNALPHILVTFCQNVQFYESRWFSFLPGYFKGWHFLDEIPASDASVARHRAVSFSPAMEKESGE